jgi:hypothetical protein
MVFILQAEERRKEPEGKRDRKQSTKRERIFPRTEDQVVGDLPQTRGPRRSKFYPDQRTR